MRICNKVFNTLIILMMLLGLLFSYPRLSAFAASEGDYSVAEADEIKYQDLFYYKLIDGKLHITRAVDDEHFNENGELAYTDRCMITSLSIPETLPVGGVAYPVEYIDGKVGSADGAFRDCYNLKTLSLPSSLKEIGDNAFRGCTALTSVQLPAGLEKLGCGAFGGCSALYKVNLPKDCHAGDYAGEIMYDGPFCGTESLTEVTIADGSTFIDNAMFDNSGIRTITIPDSVTRIGSNAFRSTYNLSTVNISKTSRLESIGWTAFSGSAITSIYLPDTVNYVDVGAFAACEQLETVRLSESITCNQYQTERGYDTGIFNSCTSLTNIVFPEGITKIGRCWFFDSPIESITIPSAVKEIESGAFRYCLNLNKVVFEKGCSLESIGSTAFRRDSNLTEFNFPDTLKTISDHAFEETGLISADLPDSLETLFYGAFNGCKSLTSVTIPANMSFEWGDNNGAFEGCDSLKTVVFKEGVTKIDDGLFGWNNGLESIVIPEGITQIGRRAFRRNHSLKSVTLPESLLSIGGEAFSDCENLKTIKLKGPRPEVTQSICENVTATVKFGIWDLTPDNWGGTLKFEGEVKNNKLYFDKNGGKCDTSYKAMKKGDAYGTLPKASRKGYKFRGWYTEADGGSKVSAKTIFKSDGDETVFANWKANKYNIKFNKNGGSGSMKTMKNLAYGKQYTLKKNKFSKKGYIFRGWSKSKKGTIIYTNKAKIRNVTTKNKKTITLYAIWKKNPVYSRYTIKYNANGGSGSMKPSKTWSNVTYTLRKNTFTRKGYTFIGWSIKKNGPVKFGDKAAVRELTTKAKSTVTLYAVWVKDSNTSKIKKAQKNTPKVYGCVICGCNGVVDGKRTSTLSSATSFYNKLRMNKIGGYLTKKENIQLKKIEGDDAPRRDILETWIKETFASTSKNDISFVYYAGHGDGGGKNGTGRGICLRTEGGGVDYYSYDDFLGLLDESIKGKVILIVDACFSEGFAIAAKKSPLKSRIAVLASSSIDEESQSENKWTQNDNIIGSIAEYFLEKNKDGTEYLVFTYALMKGLNWEKSSKYPADVNKDKVVTCEELYAYINSNIYIHDEYKIQLPKCYLGKLKNQTIFSY